MEPHSVTDKQKTEKGKANLMLQLTVAIPTHNRAKFLESCLESLLGQDIGLENFAVIVIDNASTDSTQDVIKKFTGKFPYFTSYIAPVIGLSHAKNMAMEQCETQWIGYLDDDGKARPNWLSEAMKIIKQDKCVCFGGYYYPWLKYGPLPKWAPENYGSNDHGQTEAGPLPAPFYPCGGNCFFRVDILRQYGGFPTNFGMSGKKIAYGEETSLIHQMREGGQSIWVAPQVVMDHCVQKYKYSMLWNIKSVFSSARDYARIVRKKDKDFAYTSARCCYHLAKIGYLQLKNILLFIRVKPFEKACYMFFQALAARLGDFTGTFFSK